MLRDNRNYYDANKCINAAKMMLLLITVLIPPQPPQLVSTKHRREISLGNTGRPIYQKRVCNLWLQTLLFAICMGRKPFVFCSSTVTMQVPFVFPVYHFLPNLWWDIVPEKKKKKLGKVQTQSSYADPEKKPFTNTQTLQYSF